MWMDSRVVVVVPAWDEEPRIERVLRAMPALVDAVVVVDDASRDRTADRVRAVRDSRIRLVRHERNRGVGAAIATGYRAAFEVSADAHDAFVVMAGDGQMAPSDLPALVAPIADGQADYVKGNRFAFPGVASQMPLLRRWGGMAFSWATSIALGAAVRDSQCGYTAITRRACSELDLDGLWPRYGYPNDLLSQLVLRGCRIREVPVRPVYADEVSRLKLRHLPVVAALIGRAWARRTARRWSDSGPERPIEDRRHVRERMVEVEELAQP